MSNRDELEQGEPHPASDMAMAYVTNNLNRTTTEALASCAIEGNRLSEICMGTINRLKKGEPVSDRYLLGLAFALKTLEGDK